MLLLIHARMDKRRLKKMPSLLGQTGTSRLSINNQDELCETKKQTPLKEGSKTCEENLTDDSGDESPVWSSSNRKKGRMLTSTQMSESRNVENVSQRARLASVSPERVIFSEDSDDNGTFVTKSKKLNKSKTPAKASKKLIAISPAVPKTPESKRKRLRRSNSSDSECTPTVASRKRRISVRTNTPSKISGNSSETCCSVERNSEEDEDTEEFQPVNRKQLSGATRKSAVKNSKEDEDIEEFEPLSRKRLSGATRQSAVKNMTTPQKRKKNERIGRNKPDAIKDESTDDDMFNEGSPKKGSRKHGKISPSQLLDSPATRLRKRNCIAEQKSLSKSPQHSRMSRGQSVKKSLMEKNVANYLRQFLKHAGIIITDDGPNELCKSRCDIVNNLNKLLSSKQYDKEEIIKHWTQYIENVDNLQNVLEQTVNDNQDVLIDENTESVARILLHVSPLQTGISVSLLDRLAMAVLVEETPSDVPWSGTLLRQFKFLEQIVEPNTFVVKLQELLESAQTCFQSEIISYLPDIVIDAQHHIIGEILSKLLDDNPELTEVILDCISRLTLSKDYLGRIREKCFELLQQNLKLNAVPTITRFILAESLLPETCIKALMAIRSIDMQALAGENIEECFTNQVLTVAALKRSNQVSKQIADAALTVVQRVKKDPKPLDLIMLLLNFSSNSAKKKNVETLVKNRVRSGFYRPSLLKSLYYDYKEVARDLQSVAITLASHLLKAGDRVYAEFAIEWFRLLFLSQAETVHKQQEVLAKIIKLTMAGTATSKNALAILSKMARDENERKHLQKHSHHLRTLLEEVDELDLEEVATVSDLLHGLCMSSNSTSEALQADLDIVLLKQLAASKPVTKCKGVLGALMAIKHAAAYPRTVERALQLFEQAIKAVKSCSRARALFYDQMADIIANTPDFDEKLLKETITDHFTAELSDLYLTKVTEYSGPLSVRFSLNSEAESPVDDEFGVSFGDGKDGSAVSALFRLIKACHMRGSDGDLSLIDGLLACPVFLPKDLNDPDEASLDQIFHCINWFRETISGFVTQTDSTMQRILLKRLDHLMNLQAELSMNLAMTGSHYQPPVCYFHYFPSPPFCKVEKRTGKRGNKTSLDKSGSLSEWSCWESGFDLISKNPAYFRQLDAKIAHLLDFSMEIRLTQSRPKTITIAQVCFIVKELLGMLENEASQSFMRDLVGLLPKVCSKLDQVITELRDKDDIQNRECLQLLLSLLAAIFNWKGFHNFVNNQMLREALRIVASQTDEMNTLLRSCKELVTQSCSYVESLADVATRIPVAIALVNLYEALIQHSESLASQHRGNLAKMAFGFLCLDWPEDKRNISSYRSAIKTLLKSWLNNEPDPLDTVVTLLKWLPEETEKLSKPQDSLARILSITKSTFNLLFNQIFLGLIEGVKKSLDVVKRDGERIQIWNSVATGVQRIVRICKMMEVKANWLLFLQRIPVLLRLFITSGMPVLEHNLKYHVEEVTGIVKQLQEGTRYLHVLCCHSTVTGDTTLAKYVPVAKSTLEKLVFSVKGMLVLNNSSQAFWMGNLINKDIKGQAIEMEQNTEESTTVSAGSITDMSEELLTDGTDESTDEEIE
ncbi:Fanconi anemia group D2 protein isoform X1 [Neodiprion pinetum]|uniref:Fanconi anemia group D2 protein isoform X1 n=2 Tax=Neodiprion pinetum TaxID=441929 RepID=UPI001EDECCE7|nr:Fanconi anemia group D2 protein isoform X1 [Neodiprion pinetum]